MRIVRSLPRRGDYSQRIYAPMTRQEVHELIDEIPDERLDSVAAILVEIVEDEDEPLTAPDVVGLNESNADVAAERVRPMRQVEAELGL